MEAVQLTNHDDIIRALDRFVYEKNELEDVLLEQQRIGISISYKDETPTFLDIVVATQKFDFQASGNVIVLFEGAREMVLWDCQSASIETEECKELSKDIIRRIELNTEDKKFKISLEQLYFLDYQKDE